MNPSVSDQIDAWFTLHSFEFSWVYQTSSVDAEVVQETVAIDAAPSSVFDFAERVDQSSAILRPAA